MVASLIMHGEVNSHSKKDFTETFPCFCELQNIFPFLDDELSSEISFICDLNILGDILYLPSQLTARTRSQSLLVGNASRVHVQGYMVNYISGKP